MAPSPTDEAFFLRVKRGVLQYVLIKPIVSIAVVILHLTDTYVRRTDLLSFPSFLFSNGPNAPAQLWRRIFQLSARRHLCRHCVQRQRHGGRHLSGHAVSGDERSDERLCARQERRVVGVRVVALLTFVLANALVVCALQAKSSLPSNSSSSSRSGKASASRFLCVHPSSFAPSPSSLTHCILFFNQWNQTVFHVIDGFGIFTVQNVADGLQVRALLVDGVGRWL